MEHDNIPDLFADGISLAAGPFGVTLSCHLSKPGETAEGQVGELVARIRLSPSLAFELGALLRKAQEDAAKATAEGRDASALDKTA